MATLHKSSKRHGKHSHNHRHRHAKHLPFHTHAHHLLKHQQSSVAAVSPTLVASLQNHLAAKTAIFDMKTGSIILPNGTILEAGSGYGASKNNPAHQENRNSQAVN